MLGALGCSSSASTISIDITAGQETTAFTEAPAVATFNITATDVSTSETLTASSTDGGSFDLGDATSTDPYIVDVAGLAADGTEVVGGRTLATVLDGIDGASLPVFAERVDAWARPPNGLDDTHVNGVAAIAAERFLMLAGGSAALDGDGASIDPSNPDFYDVAGLGDSSATSGLPITPATIVGLGTVALLIDDASAVWLSFEDGSTGYATAPTGLAFGDVAGGREVDTPSGVVYVVGATRAGAPTTSVLSIATDGTLAAATLAFPRAGAAAAYVQGIGLVVAGGSANGPGVEVLADGATSFVTRAYAPDATTGAAIAQTSFGAVLVGGVDASGAGAAMRQVDPTCASSTCATTTLPEAFALPFAFASAQAFSIDGNRVLVAGAAADPHAGTQPLASRSVLVDFGAMDAPTEIVLREPRRGATFNAAPNATLAVLGGVHEDGTPALDIELLFPK
jgi:hypothetical protein